MPLMRWGWVVFAAAIASTGCGSISTTLPPALHIPERVVDLSAIEQADRILVQFTLPSRTTENMLIHDPVTVDLAIGTGNTPFDLGAWAAGARRFTDVPVDQPAVKYTVPAAAWIGKTVVIAVRVLSARGRTVGWSNAETLSVIPPLAQPLGLVKEETAEGVRLTWQGDDPMYRVYRRLGDQGNATAVGETNRPPYTDTTIEYGQTYHYSVEGFRNAGDVHALSVRTPEVSCTPIDTWPPPVPTGLAAVASPGRVELVWDRSVAPDLAGYKIYRAEGDGSFVKIGETREGPSYSDLTVVPGKTYRYAVSAFDQIPNESGKSAPVSIHTE